jgi:hypothetical protein
VTAAAPLFSHILALTDGTGLFEHALLTRPRIEHGYCVDDVARGLVVLSRADETDRPAEAGAPLNGSLRLPPHRPSPTGELAQVAWTYLRFVAGAQDRRGRVVNRCGTDGVRHGDHGVEDCWGRALWGLGSTAAQNADIVLAGRAMSLFEVSVAQRSPWPRAMAFAGLGAAQVLHVNPAHSGARSLLADAATSVGRRGDDASWPWPQSRLSYANAVVPEVLMAAGDGLGDGALVEDGLAMLGWLLDTQTRQGHLSVTPAGGRGPGDPEPAFDQQPIEVAALADACARAYDLTGDERWAKAVSTAAAWFFGANDAGAQLYDPASGGCRDGLEPDGCNENQGAESTLALISTLQQASRLATTHA